MAKQSISARRRELNLSQEYMAKQLGICRDTYISYEKMPSKISMSNAQKIASLLGRTTDELIFLP